MATFYISLFPVGGAPPNAEAFFQSYLAAPIVLVLFAFWKIYTRDWGFLVKTKDMDIDTGRRDFDDLPPTQEDEKNRNPSIARRLSTAIF